MNTVTLRTLLREPSRVKRITGTGKAVQVTDKGQPLWIIHPAAENKQKEAERQRAIDEVLDDVLREKPSNISAAKLLDDSRR
jgi:hypothetical protein